MEKMKLVFESLSKSRSDKIYQDSLGDSYWKFRDKFPNYNSPDSEDNKKAVNYILDGIKKKYEVSDPEIIRDLKNKIHSGIT